MDRPSKIQDFMYAIMEETRRNSLVEVCKNFDISTEEMRECIAYIEETLEVSNI